MNQSELIHEFLSLKHFGSIGWWHFAGWLIKLHNHFTACYHEQGKSVTQADSVLINSRYVVSMCDMCLSQNSCWGDDSVARFTEVSQPNTPGCLWVFNTHEDETLVIEVTHEEIRLGLFLKRNTRFNYTLFLEWHYRLH